MRDPTRHSWLGWEASPAGRHCDVPGSVDWVLNSMRLNIGFGLMGAFIGEFIASERGLGHLVLKASGLYNVPRALAATLGITLLAWVLDLCASEIEKRRHALVQVLAVPRRLWSNGLLRRRS
jgi:NitT/TauT family transport system permease protein